MVCIGNLVVQNSWLKLGYAEVRSQLDMIAAVAKWTKAVGPGPIYRGFESHPAAFFFIKYCRGMRGFRLKLNSVGTKNLTNNVV
jgi:hypothetical protein